MMTIRFLGEWLVRSSVLILGGMALVWMLRVKNPAVRLMVWKVLLAGSLAIPFLSVALPTVPVKVGRAPAHIPPVIADALPIAGANPGILAEMPMPSVAVSVPPPAPAARRRPFDWVRFTLVLYGFIATALLLRLVAGLVSAHRIYRRSRSAGLAVEGPEIRESTGVASPVAVGIFRPVVLLPTDWRTWSAAKLSAVLAHEGSHVRRHDPAVQFLSAIHRAALWASPASWLLHRSMVRDAEQISDDDGVAATRDRVQYAEVLLEFMTCAVGQSAVAGVPMARYERPERRIRRILNATSMHRQLTRWGAAGILVLGSSLAYLASAAAPQASSSSAGQPAFEITDVHFSPRNQWVRGNGNRMQGGYLAGDRYELRRATLADLIRVAYNVDTDRIAGGPAWIDYDRFEVIGKTKPGTPAQSLRLMLRTLLADRFHLVVKTGTRPLPGILLTKGKGKPTFKAAAPGPPGGCQFSLEMSGGAPRQTLRCRNVTMDEFAQTVQPRLSSPPKVLPVVDATGLEGTWDIDLDMPFDASLTTELERLGLKTEKGDVPQPVLTVESAERPGANPPDVADKLPPLASPEFEVASVRPCADNMTRALRFEAGGRVTGTCEPLASLIRDAWGLPLFIDVVGLPKSMVDQSLSIVAKAPAGVAPDPQHRQEARDVLHSMLRALLIERYQMKVHFEERPVDAQQLVAVKPKLAKADPAERTGCTRESQVSNGRALQVRVVCRNITMAQFVEQLPGMDSVAFPYPVKDATGLEGAWDFTLDYDVMATLNSRYLPARLAGPTAAGTSPGDQAAEPSGTLSLEEAIKKQLGLKLEAQKRPEPVLVIDHIAEKPIEN